jgi:hypothetical protein
VGLVETGFTEQARADLGKRDVHVEERMARDALAGQVM